MFCFYSCFFSFLLYFCYEGNFISDNICQCNKGAAMGYEDVLEIFDEQIKSGLVQGIVAQSNRDDSPVFAGMQTGSLPMSANSRFDIASLGKTFTATNCALLIDAGKLDPDAPFSEYLPEYVQGKNCRITVRDLASHSSGFSNSKPYHRLKPGPFEEKLFQLLPKWERRTHFEYSCANFILLGRIVERLTGKDLDAVSRELIWGPLNMNSTTWYPPGNGPDEVLHHDPVRTPGEHNDWDCFVYEKPLGAGSCFSTVPDLLKFLKAILSRSFFPEKVYDLIYTCDFECDGTRRSFGWDMSDSGRPASLSCQTIHHTGWTGQSLFVDPVNDFCAVVLSSRLGDHDVAVDGRIRIADVLYSNSFNNK